MKITMCARKFFAIFLALTLTLTGCVKPPEYRESNQNIDQAQAYLEQQRAAHTLLSERLHPAGSLVLSNESNPAWLTNKIALQAKQMPFIQLVDRIVQNTPGINTYDGRFDKQKRISFEYTGTIRGALDRLAAKQGWSYQVHGDTIVWSQMVTRTFDISFIPGASEYSVGGTAGASVAGGAGGSGTNGGLAATGTNAITASGNSNQYSNLQGTLSVWDDLQKTIKDLLSKEGKVIVSQATTTITVHDYASNVRAVANYLASMNKGLSRQVALDVQVLQVHLSKGANYGINWGLVRNFMSGRLQLGLTSTMSQNVSLPALGTNNAAATAGLMLKGTGGVWDGTNMLINALSQQGKVSVSTQPRVVTLNNQVAEIGINTLTSYLAQVTNTNTANVGTSVSLTPGQVVTGFTLYLLPKIQGHNVYLQISSTIANLEKISVFGIGTQDSTGNYQNQIQMPTVSQKRFNQRSLVPSGDTLIIAGFKEVNNQANKSAIGGLDALGGTGASESNLETIVLITPTIITVN